MATLADLLTVRSLRTERERAYLNEQVAAWLAGRTRAESRAPLSDAEEEIYQPSLYVPMDGASSRWFRDEAGGLQPADEPIPDGASASATQRKTPASVRALLAWWACRRELPRLVLVGSPGQGKSVFLTRFAAALARAFRGADPGIADVDLSALRLPDGRMRLPVVVDANDIPRAGAQGGVASTLAAAMYERLVVERRHISSEGEIRAGLVGGRYVLLVDAWDEIPDAPTRGAVLRLLRSLATELPSTRLVLTTRSASYTGDAAFGPELEVVTLQPLSDEQFRALVGQWVHEKRRSASKVDADAYEEVLVRAISAIAGRLDAQDSAEGVPGNPLMLTALCEVYDKHGAGGQGRALLEDRAELCETIVAELCASKSSSREGIGELLASDKRRILERFALSMQRKTEGPQVLPIGSAKGESLAWFKPG
ncbi:MAG: NACHT domain-containing protein [Planctomycetes bacterium]|nr:NACHT domain-containing protein [Planctomycetota bacterium]